LLKYKKEPMALDAHLLLKSAEKKSFIVAYMEILKMLWIDSTVARSFLEKV
jgi:hypothetical protein